MVDQILNLYDVPLAYLPGNATRVVAKAVGDLLGSAPSSKPLENAKADGSVKLEVAQDKTSRETQQQEMTSSKKATPTQKLGKTVFKLSSATFRIKYLMMYV